MGTTAGLYAEIKPTFHCHPPHNICSVFFPIELFWINQNTTKALNEMKKEQKEREGTKN
jgi:hypothetical protein